MLNVTWFNLCWIVLNTIHFVIRDSNMDFNTSGLYNIQFQSMGRRILIVLFIFTGVKHLLAKSSVACEFYVSLMTMDDYGRMVCWSNRIGRRRRNLKKSIWNWKSIYRFVQYLISEGCNNNNNDNDNINNNWNKIMKGNQ